MLAATSNAIIVGFNVRPDAVATAAAARSNVDMRMYRVIYDAIDEIEVAMKGMLAPKFREVILGHAEVRQTYKVSGVGTIAGCYVQDGKLQRKDCQIRLVRDGIVVHEGMLASLQRFKDSVKEVASGYECGLSIEKFNDIKEGDIVEAFTMEEIPQ
jgi:translation initiation factor IF-2